MRLKSSVKVFLFLRVIEGLLSLACALFHYISFNNKSEPTGRQLPFGLLYFGFFSAALFAISRLVRGILKVKLEVVTVGLGFILFLIAAIFSMSNAEKDPHLKNFQDGEESQHPYHRKCLYQSLVSHATSLIFLMHLKFVVCLMKSQISEVASTASSATEEDNETIYRLYFFPGKIWNKAIKSVKECRRKVFP